MPDASKTSGMVFYGAFSAVQMNMSLNLGDVGHLCLSRHLFEPVFSAVQMNMSLNLGDVGHLCLFGFCSSLCFQPFR
jgi:hypothetical protein